LLIEARNILVMLHQGIGRVLPLKLIELRLHVTNSGAKAREGIARVGLILKLL
jgi:hypothetical protein